MHYRFPRKTVVVTHVVQHTLTHTHTHTHTHSLVPIGWVSSTFGHKALFLTRHDPHTHTKEVLRQYVFEAHCYNFQANTDPEQPVNSLEARPGSVLGDLGGGVRLVCDGVRWLRHRVGGALQCKALVRNRRCMHRNGWCMHVCGSLHGFLVLSGVCALCTWRTAMQGTR